MNNEDRQYTVQGTATIEDAFALMDTTNVRRLFVVDENERLIGVVDGVVLRKCIADGVSSRDSIGTVASADMPFLFDTDIENEAELRNKITYLQNTFTLSSTDRIPVCANDMTIVSLSDPDMLHIAAESRTVKESVDEQNREVKRICIIGGGGYLGSVLAERLLRKGYTVRIFDTFIFGKESLARLEKTDVLRDSTGSLDIYDGDMRNTSDVINALVGVDAVVLLGAVVGDPASSKYPVATFEVNYLAAQAIAEICAYLNINRFLFSSTCSVYGQSDQGVVADENTPLNPVSHYARTKIEAEGALLRIPSPNFAPTIMRMSTLYGPSHRMRYDLVVNTMMMKALTTGKITVFGGEQWRPLLCVDDAADAFIAVLESDIHVVKRQIYNVGDEKENYQIKEIGLLITDYLKSKGEKVEMEIIPNDLDLRDYKVSFEKLRSSLRFHVQHTVVSTLDRLYTLIRAELDADITASASRYNVQNPVDTIASGQIISVNK
jgi:nucleoside-diphosphate-sugar epimerase